MHLVGPYYADISRCTVHRTSKVQCYEETHGKVSDLRLSVWRRSLTLHSWCRQYAKADICSVCAFLLCYVWWEEKKSRDKSRYEEHQKLSCKISPLVFYFKANNKKMRGVAAITVPWRQGHTAPHPAKQTSEAARREICDDKETNDDATKDKRVAECSLSSYFFPVHFLATNSRRTLILPSNACRIWI